MVTGTQLGGQLTDTVTGTQLGGQLTYTVTGTQPGGQLTDTVTGTQLGDVTGTQLGGQLTGTPRRAQALALCSHHSCWCSRYTRRFLASGMVALGCPVLLLGSVREKLK